MTAIMSRRPRSPSKREDYPFLSRFANPTTAHSLVRYRDFGVSQDEVMMTSREKGETVLVVTTNIKPQAVLYIYVFH